MALVWAFTFDGISSSGTFQDNNGGAYYLLQDGWGYSYWHNYSPDRCEAQLGYKPRQPLVGYGGSTRALQVWGNTGLFPQSYCWVYTKYAAFPGLDDGIFQFHYQQDNTSTLKIIDVLAEDGTVLFQLYPSGSNLRVLYRNTSGSMLEALVTVATIGTYQWHTIALRMKCHATEGKVEVCVDGGVVATSTDLEMGATYGAKKWNRFILNGPYAAQYSSRYFAQLSVYDNNGDNALSIQKWVAWAPARVDVDIGAWTDEAAGTTNLYDGVDEIDIVNTDYCTTNGVGVPGSLEDEIWFSPNTDESINAAWAPLAIDGVCVNGVARGDGELGSGHLLVASAGNASPQAGTAKVLTTSSRLMPVLVQPTNPAGGALTKALVNALEFGLKVN